MNSIILNRRTLITSLASFGAACALNPSQALAVTAAQKQAEVRTVKSQLEAIAEEASAVGDRYHEAMDAYEDASSRVNEAERTISECSQKIVVLQDRLDTRAAAMYRSGASSYLEVLLGVTSFEDFATVWETLNELNEEDANLAANTKITKATLESAKGELVVQKDRAAEQLGAAKTHMQQVLTRQSEYDRIYENLSEEYRQILAEQEAADAQRSARQTQDYTPAPAQTPQPQQSVPSTNSGSANNASKPATNSTPAPAPTNSGTKAVKENKPTQVSSPATPTNEGVVAYARTKIGLPYIWGAKGPDAFDCSGFVAWCYKQIGMSLPSYTESLYAVAKARFAPSEARPGDVLYKPGHVGISTGGISCIEAMGSRWGVCESRRGGWTAALRF